MEKAEETQLEHINTTQTESPPGEKLEVKHTLQHVDIENRYAFKGDDSDGKIEWTIRKIFASAFLAMLYTGTIPSKSPSASVKRLQDTVADTVKTRVANPPLLCGRKSHVHGQRPRNLNWHRLAAHC
jgi:hypothetical protein